MKFWCPLLQLEDWEGSGSLGDDICMPEGTSVMPWYPLLQLEDWEGSGGLGDVSKPALTRSQKEREEDLQSW